MSTADGVDYKTDVEAGPVNRRLAMTFARGTYTYVCDVHPSR